MKIVFGDTLYWVALTHPGDQWHHAAIRATTALGEVQIVTTEEVLVEYLNALGAVFHIRRVAAERVERLRVNPNVEVVAQSPASFASGFALYQQRSDKTYSLTDCISMATMRQRSIVEVLTHDHHFEQEGFIPLIKR